MKDRHLPARISALTLVLLAAAALPAAAQATLPTDARLAPRPAGFEALTRLGVLDATVQRIALPETAGAPIVTSIVIEGAPRTLLLDPVSLRAPGFRLLVQGQDGELQQVSPAPPATYRGTLPEYPGSVVSGSLLDGGLTGSLLLRPGDAPFGIQPLSALESSADPAEHVVYDSRDQAPTDATCGVPTLALPHAEGSDEATSGAPGGGATSVRICEIACDADFEFYQSKGSSVANVQADIENILNGVENIYSSDVEVLYQITTIVVRTNSSDPYTTASPGGLLDEFQIEWNQNQNGVQRDVAHLFTGRNLSGSTIGIASLGVICTINNAYGLSQSNFSGSFTFRVGLTAHELGHNWSAFHCDGQGDCKIMCSGIGGCGPVTSFGSSAISSILGKKASVNCLSLPPPSVTPTLLSVNPASVQALGGGTITLNGDDFNTASQVDVGGVLLGPGAFTVTGSTKLTFSPPVPLALGANDVTVTNVVGVSNVATLTYTAIDPP
ncbi:MAG TPA: M12 family metallo-peptidase, partial [Nitriliruptorales bacterium]